MRKAFSCLLILLLVLSAAAFAEGTAEYRDSIYSFRYPASWSQGIADNGDIVLGSPSGTDAVITFAIMTDLVSFTGDAAADASAIEGYIAEYGGKNLALTGEYDLITSGVMKGFRAYGSWRATQQNAVMVLLTGERHMIGFVLVGDDAIALEEDFLNSVELLNAEPTQGAAGFLRWQGAQYAVDYPEHYGVTEQMTGVVFINPDDANNIIMARAYDLDVDYVDDMAPVVASSTLPKSMHLEAQPEVVQVGDRRAAVISGQISTGPMALYAIGSGRTALVLIFMGEEAVELAETIVRSVQF